MVAFPPSPQGTMSKLPTRLLSEVYASLFSIQESAQATPDAA